MGAYSNSYTKRFKVEETWAEIVRDGLKWLALCAIFVIIVLIVKLEYETSKDEADELSQLYTFKDGNSSSFDGYDEEQEEFASFNPFNSILGHSLEMIYFKVYRPRGLFVDLETRPLLTLKHIQRPNCVKPFVDYFSQYKGYSGSVERPSIPDEKSPFLMGGMATLKQEEESKIINKWSRANVLNYIDSYHFAEISQVPNDFWRNTEWDWGSVGLHHAFDRFPIEGKSGMIYGSDGKEPWVENFAIMHGAKDLMIVEQQKILSNRDSRLQYITPFDLAKNYENHSQRYDFVVSFAQLSKLGLGMNGEIVDPFADIDAILRIGCTLKKDGILFFGDTIGRDSLHLNTRRMYGRIRLPMLFAGFELMDTFLNSQIDPVKLDGNCSGTNGKSYMPDILDSKFKKHPMLLWRILNPGMLHI
ncbi:unnamed protein product, partial [Mesorhabditis belari]|uniref:Uncharacterized protein n=1 Tax=Mesorhabditis belari TaxID=2138241 RepID=A0AAF3F0E4_9BILA